MHLVLADHLSEKGLDKWISALSVSNAPALRRHVQVALRFFARHMPALQPDVALSFIRCMDLSKNVAEIPLVKGERLIAFRSPSEDPFKLFYTRSGADANKSGINPAGRSARSFTVRTPSVALQSFATGANDTWSRPLSAKHMSVSPRGNTTGFLAAGGGVQLIVPNAHTVLLFDR
jgi:hypothetical protein